MTRARLLTTLQKLVATTPEIRAAWEQGSKAFGRDDADSDVDLSLVARDDAVDLVVAKLEAALATDGLVVDLSWEVPQPTWHGHWQTFYRFRDLPPLLLLDAAVMRASSPSLLCEPEIHGTKSDVWVDRDGVLAKHRLDANAHVASMRKAFERAKATTEMFHPFVEKELRRGRPVDALHFYNTLILSKLIEAQRMLHCPQRFHFGPRYLKEDLPAAAAARIERLLYVASPAKLPELKAEAVSWLRETLAELGRKDFRRHLEEKLKS